jgi:hypothetical protein
MEAANAGSDWLVPQTHITVSSAVPNASFGLARSEAATDGKRELGIQSSVHGLESHVCIEIAGHLQADGAINGRDFQCAGPICAAHAGFDRADASTQLLVETRMVPLTELARTERLRSSAWTLPLMLFAEKRRFWGKPTLKFTLASV